MSTPCWTASYKRWNKNIYFEQGTKNQQTSFNTSHNGPDLNFVNLKFLLFNILRSSSNYLTAKSKLLKEMRKIQNSVPKSWNSTWNENERQGPERISKVCNQLSSNLKNLKIKKKKRLSKASWFYWKKAKAQNKNLLVILQRGQILWCYREGGRCLKTGCCYYSVAMSCPILWDPMNYTVHGILQARILEWVAVPFSYISSFSLFLFQLNMKMYSLTALQLFRQSFYKFSFL